MKSRIIEILSAALSVSAVVLGSGLGLNLYHNVLETLIFGDSYGMYTWHQIAEMVTVMLLTDILFFILVSFILVLIAVYVMRMSCEELISSFYKDKSLLQKIDKNDGQGLPWCLFNLPRKYIRKICAIFAPQSL